MTVRTANGAPPGMPPHLWEAAKRDVRGVIPDWLRSAEENGADAPPHIREVARRAARAGAGLGMAIAVGGGAHAAASTGDGAAVMPAEAFHVAGTAQGALTVEMYQDVVVNEAAAAGYDVDAFQYLVISDDGGRTWVFKEHHHAALAEPPARETDLLIHERGQVHVTENPDGSFSMDTVGYDRSVRGPDDRPVEAAGPGFDGAAWLDEPRPDAGIPEPHATADPIGLPAPAPDPVAPELDAPDTGPDPDPGTPAPAPDDITDGPDATEATGTPDDPEHDPSPDVGPLLV